ncbi:ribbon-helix-helix protein, CopG family [Thermoleophilum album]|uniref:Ribbon-helix-helix protein, copG family n=1 Tax=Thermoleophilum album TaxID=29539 RepID=A0A1H6FJF6_THEAL|nr:ribbon-helix-helix protein, CopG family [Thermoleophilum album]SEH10532.1 Ribbon-helix-helix protein, copG family [Thermoleophilum album]
MRATTVRFSADLWELLEREAARSGVSVAQYVREAALARIAYTAGLRGEGLFQPPPEHEEGADKGRGRGSGRGRRRSGGGGGRSELLALSSSEFA